MARTTWFETVAIAQQRGKKLLPKSVYAALIAASEKGLTASDNVEAFGELVCPPHWRVGQARLSTTVMGQQLSFPSYLADWCAGGAPRRRDRGRQGGCRPWHGDGAVVVRQQADRRGHRGEPQTLLSAVLAR
jgi:hypothetical protein